ncbi:MAG: hypothetical protein KDC20_12325, partial [Bacteroidetes bacterium]|nr:hypothetical protein [Bacteroidota bacterium]
MQDEFQQKDFKEQSFNLKQFLFEKILGYWYLYVIALALALIIARYYLWYTTPIYTSTTSLMLGMNDRKYGEGDLIARLTSMDNSGSIESEMQIIKSRNIITRTIEQLDFNLTYWLEGDIKTSELYKNSPFELIADSTIGLGSIPEIIVKVNSKESFELSYSKQNNSDENVVIQGQFDKPIKTDFGSVVLNLKDPGRLKIYKNLINEKNIYRISPRSTDALVSSYNSRTTVSQVKGTRMLVVSVDDAVPQKACDYLNKLTEVYVAYGVEQKNEDTQNSLKFIDQQLSIITNELLDSEGKLEKYKTENSIFDIAGSATLSQEDIARIENDLSTIEVRNALLKY